MATITIRNLDEDIKQQIRIKAAKNGRSMEEETRVALRELFPKPAPANNNWVEEVREMFRKVGFTDDVPEVKRERFEPKVDYSDW